MSKNLSEPIRSHKDLDKDSATHFHKAVKFYKEFSKQLVHQGQVLDLFACALDQVIFPFLFVISVLQFLSSKMSCKDNEDLVSISSTSCSIL